MSRSAFAARFTQLVGEPAMHYVARWRMYVALGWLQNEAIGLDETASRLGYRSEAAFSRAFKRLIGVSPGSVRRRSTPIGAALVAGHVRADAGGAGADFEPEPASVPSA
jgi:AraC-like DNA-binding protein